MKKYLASILIILFAATALYAQGGCFPAPRGPNPVPMANAAQYNQSQSDAMARQQAVMSAQHRFQESVMSAQHQYQMQQLQNRSNPQAAQAAAQAYQRQMQQLQQQFQSDMQAAQRR